MLKQLLFHLFLMILTDEDTLEKNLIQNYLYDLAGTL
jgi:hypothetical protein